MICDIICICMCERNSNGSSFRSSSLALRSQIRKKGFSLRIDLKEGTRRNASGGVRSVLREFLTGEHEQKVKETLEFYVHEIRSPNDESATADPNDENATADLNDESATADPNDENATADPNDESATADPNDESATLKLANLPPNTAPLQWGSSFVFDNEVREGLGADSSLLGRERGWGVVTDQHSEEGLQLTSKISFIKGKYEGSTITLSGNVGGKKTPYELIINGGTGHFRGAHGYVLADNAPNDGPRFIFHWKVFLL
jgi:hypothetical protein